MTPVRILLADDSQFSVRDFTRKLAKWAHPHKLDVVRDGQEAIDYLGISSGEASSTLTDLLVLDLNMPKLGGIEVLEAIRQCESLKDLPVLIHTTSDSSFDIESTKRLNANGYLYKGTPAEEIWPELERNLPNAPKFGPVP